jgi:hypothetical protein
LTKKPKTYIGEKTVSSTKEAERNNYMPETETGPLCLTLYKINSPQTKDLNVIPKASKLLLEKIGKTLRDIAIDYYFLNRTPITQKQELTNGRLTS